MMYEHEEEVQEEEEDEEGRAGKEEERKKERKFEGKVEVAPGGLPNQSINTVRQ